MLIPCSLPDKCEGEIVFNTHNITLCNFSVELKCHIKLEVSVSIRKQENIGIGKKFGNSITSISFCL